MDIQWRQRLFAVGQRQRDTIAALLPPEYRGVYADSAILPEYAFAFLTSEVCHKA